MNYQKALRWGVFMMGIVSLVRGLLYSLVENKSWVEPTLETAFVVAIIYAMLFCVIASVDLKKRDKSEFVLMAFANGILMIIGGLGLGIEFDKYFGACLVTVLLHLVILGSIEKVPSP
jgi:hypothetical protein